MGNFTLHIDPLIEKEGGYKLTNNTGDRGGLTYAGISRRANPDWHGWTDVDEGEKPSNLAVSAHYKTHYWNPMACDDIDSEVIAGVLLSSSVLSGPRRAIALAQASCEAPADGVMGPITLKELNSIDPELFTTRFALARIARFSEIVRRDKSQEKFLRGWVNRVLREMGAQV